MPPEKSSAKDKWLLFLLGALGLYGFMFLYLAGLSKTTPVSSSIFTSLQPIWVFLMMIFFYKEKATTKKIIGISIGLIGALVCILTQQSDDLASDAFTGNMLCLLSSVVYAVFLILSQRILTAAPEKVYRNIVILLLFIIHINSKNHPLKAGTAVCPADDLCFNVQSLQLFSYVFHHWKMVYSGMYPQSSMQCPHQ